MRRGEWPRKWASSSPAEEEEEEEAEAEGEEEGVVSHKKKREGVDVVVKGLEPDASNRSLSAFVGLLVSS